MPSYLDSLRKLSYISPEFDEINDIAFEELTRDGGKKAAITEMPQLDEPDVQDLGENAETFSMNLYFYGDEYTEPADDFWAALKQRGVAQMKHPRWGDLVIFPTSYSQAEKFVDGMACSAFNVKFIRVKDVQHGWTGFPVSVVGEVASLIHEIDVEIREYSAIITDIFSGATLANIEKAKQSVSSSLTSIRTHLFPASAPDPTIAEKLEKSVADLERNLDTVINDPLTLLQTFIDICRLPARTDTLIKGKIRAFNNLYTDTSAFVASSASEASTISLIQSAVLVGAAESSTVGTIKTRDDVADSLSRFSELSEGFFQNASSSVGTYDTDFVLDHDTLESLHSISARAKSILQAKAYDLALEKIVTLDAYSNLLTFVYDVYGNLDFLDEFIEQNQPENEEFFILSPGRILRYFERGV
jgi:prophage DNA circulation protein